MKAITLIITGPLLIHGPSSADWDEAWDPILISDWVHDSAFAVFQQELVPPPPISQSVLLNGTGQLFGLLIAFFFNSWDRLTILPFS